MSTSVDSVGVSLPRQQEPETHAVSVAAVARAYPETNLRVGTAERAHGEVRVSMEIGPWAALPDGTPAVGALGVLIDDAIGTDVWWDRPAGTASVTSELSLDVVVPPPWPAPRLLAQASLLALDAAGGLSRCGVRDSTGRVVVVATGRCRFIANGVPPLHERPVAPRPAVGSSVLVAAGLAAPDDTVAWPTGLVERTEDTARLVVPAATVLSNSGGTVHGGMHLCLSDLAAAAMAEPGQPEQTVSLRISYLRPADPAQPIAYTARVVHRGRALAAYQVTSTGPSGKPCTVATVTRVRQPAP